MAATKFSKPIDNEIATLNSKITNITKVVTKTITLDSSGKWGGWNGDIGMAGYVLLGAYPNAWAPTTVICDKDGYFSISCPSKASSSLAFKLLGIKANVVH